MKKAKKIEKGLKAFFATRFAIRKDEAEKLASVDFEWEKKPNGEWEVKNCIEYRKDGIAVINIDGPLSYRADLWSAWLGLDTYDSITSALDEVLNDRDVDGVVLNINSPGGEVSGCSDLADKIYNARGSKKYGIVARTGGLMCSAAYWIGSSCEKVYSSAQGTIGSIGVLCAYSKNAEEVDVVVSDLSKNKCPTPDNAEGLAQIKKELNDLASVFIAAVARNRGTTAEDVEMNFGQGGVFIGENAVAAGLADGVVSLDDVCEMMKKGSLNGGAYMATEQQAPKAEMTGNPKASAPESAPAADLEDVKKKAVADYKARVASINAVFDGLDVSAEEIQKFVDEDKSVAEATEFALAQAKSKIKAQADDLAKVNAELADAKAKAEATPANPVSAQSEKERATAALEAAAAAQNSVQGSVSSEDDAKALEKLCKSVAEKRYNKKG